jgi:mannose-6-phosphate isomerase-like protein (cupin superfamily)
MRALSIPSHSRHLYQEFIRSADLSVGVYRLDAGATDEQRPHSEDEVYYVIRGRAKFTSGGETVDVASQLCLFVPAGAAHKFHDIVEPLELLVFFGPAEGERKTG